MIARDILLLFQVPPRVLLWQLSLAAALLTSASIRADDGYRLWLRYESISDDSLRATYAETLTQIVCVGDSPTLDVASRELAAGLGGLLEQPVAIRNAFKGDGGVLLGTPQGSPLIAKLKIDTKLSSLGQEGYAIERADVDGVQRLVIAANTDAGVLYGAFALLRHLQTHRSIDELHFASAPRISHRLLNHWDNLSGTIERGYAGKSLWEWSELPEQVNSRYVDYARACASIGINGASLTNVNANARVLTDEYISKAATLADAFRPYGVRIFLTARFSAPIEIGGLETADPNDGAVRRWWTDRVAKIYEQVPDFGGFLVKANSEGQPGPQDYGRTHKDGANMLADGLAPHGGVVMWRAFVYDAHVQEDRAKQAYDQFKPLDGEFRPNVLVQIKNGPIDFMPREPFHPLFGAMPKTPLALELQITQEYLGAATHLAYLAPMWKECLDSDTFAAGAGTPVASVIDGTLDGHRISAIAGVANTGSARNWTGHALAQANWYAFGRLAWDHSLSSRQIAVEWARMTFTNDPLAVETIVEMLLSSREAVVNYMMPLGLHHIMARGHHYGPGPWVDEGRADWTSTYYHQADEHGVGFDRSVTGSNAVEQYAPELAAVLGDVDRCPPELLLWFHHVPWDHRLKSGETLWNELCLRYQRGVEEVRRWIAIWATLEGKIDQERHAHIGQLLQRQEREACWWRDACLLYFQTFSDRPLPEGVEPPAHSLEYYQDRQLRDVPENP